MVSNYKDIIEFLKKDCEKDFEKKPEQLKEILEEIRSVMHDKIDAAKDRLIDFGVKAFEKEDSKFSEMNTEKEEDKDKDIKLKVHDLVASLDSMLKRTEYLDDSIIRVKEDPLESLLVNRKGVIDFKMTRKFQLRVQGKCSIDLAWKNPQNKPTYSSIDSKDSSLLNVHASSCYNYYQTDKEFTDENVEVTFITNCYQSNGYLYFGVRNETNLPDSHCMCCNPNSVTFFRSNGKVVVNGNNKNENKLSINKSGQENRIKVRLNSVDKEVFFEVNDKGECGPYKITGTRFVITSGSCNTLNGFIRIEDAQFV